MKRIRLLELLVLLVVAAGILVWALRGSAIDAVLSPFASLRLSWAEILDVWLSLLPNVVGVVLYLIFVYEFYRFVAHRDVFELRLRRYATHPLSRGVEILQNALRVVLYLLEYVVVYPILIILWYFVFVVLLVFLGYGLGIPNLLVTAMAIVTGIRVTAYYSEDLSRDLAKLLPLALLGVVILEGTVRISFANSLGLVRDIPQYWPRIASYLLFLVPLEFALRVGRIIATRQLSTSQPEVPESGGDTPGEGPAK